MLHPAHPQAGYHYSIWYFKTRPWTCTTIPHLSNTHRLPKTKFRATQGRSRAITAVRSMVMFRVERMNTRGKQRKQRNYLVQTNTQGFPSKDIWTLCQSLLWKQMYSSSIWRCGGVCNPASLQGPRSCAPVAEANTTRPRKQTEQVQLRSTLHNPCSVPDEICVWGQATSLLCCRNNACNGETTITFIKCLEIYNCKLLLWATLCLCLLLQSPRVLRALDNNSLWSDKYCV